MNKLQREPVVRTLVERGQQIIDGVQSLIGQTGAAGFLSISGHPSWTFLTIKDTPKCSMWEMKTLLLQEMLARGILTLGTHNISYAHSHDDIKRLLAAYAEVMPILCEAGERGVSGLLRCEPLVPLFRLR